MPTQQTILAKILAERPALHPTREGQSRCIGLHSDVLRFLYDLLAPGQRSLETGCGLSTLVFALSGCHHQAIVPNQSHIEATRQSALRYGISLDNTSFINARSELVLPALPQTELFDVVLIDGGHAFPLPFIDYFYTAGRLCVNGLLIVDDTHMKTVGILYQFLSQQPDWQEITHLHRTAIFRKTQEITVDEWDYWRSQPFNETWHSRFYKLISGLRKRFSR